jgi:hypothetical protein
VASSLRDEAPLDEFALAMVDVEVGPELAGVAAVVATERADCLEE